MLEDHPAPGEGPKIKGSVMLAHAHSKEEVIQALKDDVYTKVWPITISFLPFIFSNLVLLRLPRSMVLVHT